jgi:Predicted membrane protein (DUF2142)
LSVRASHILPLASLGLALLMAAWIVATRPFGAPDEDSHYLRALSIANGELLGPKEPFVASGHSSAELAWVRHDTRGVLVPPRLSPLAGVGYPEQADVGHPEPCLNGRLDVGSRPCVEVTHTGDYNPLSYLLPAVALSSADGWRAGLWLSRALSACACLTFLLLALAALWNGSGWSLLGPLAAVTPMVLFVGSVINPTGLETAAAIAFASAGLRIVRNRENSPIWVWVVLACSGAATLLAWQLGPIFLAIDLAALAALMGRAEAHQLLVRRRRRIRVVTVTLLVALGLYVSWAVISGVAHSTIQVTPIGSLRLGVGQLHEMFREAVGVFGYRTIRMPFVFYWMWWLLTFVVVIGAVLLGERRERMVVVGVTILGFVFPVLFYAWVYRFSGFGLQGRYMLPLLTLIPLVGGEVIQGARHRLSARASRSLLTGALAAIAAVELAAWWTSASAAAAPKPHLWFIAHATWKPPLGWWPWAGMAILGSAALAACGAEQLRAARLAYTARSAVQRA